MVGYIVGLLVGVIIGIGSVAVNGGFSYALTTNHGDLVEECEAKLPRDVKCILVAKPE